MADKIPYHVIKADNGKAICGSSKGILYPAEWYRDHRFPTVIQNATCKSCKVHLEELGYWEK